ncbi:hypothetical protein OKW21_002427 [Catalinimonas alkaloidigena]|uniref:DUF4136 domain-containing protein n=1 Tax=Catalinimonas alkaloidigena TaxID=1075417 RepID=UPI002406CD1C|nr:DUF4136 domain-containing protein [Catalinimonas alkaloidigena]MDF9797164.1 hypothetical protein [Catalinimonas alkaloidigena]
MKFLSILSALLISTPLVYGQEREVFDKVLDDAALDEYQTYAIGDAFTGPENKEWVKYSSLLNNMVENSVVYEFDTYNYDMMNADAELLVNFMIFDEAYDDKIGYMPGFRLENESGFDETILDKLGDGSLVISITDISEGKTIWSGFVPNAVQSDASLREQQKDIRQSVNDAMEVFIAKTNFADASENRFEMATEPVNDVDPDEDDSNNER